MKITKELKEFFSPDAFKEFFPDTDPKSSFVTTMLQLAGVIISLFTIFYYMQQLG